ncbi:EAL domain-containing protein [Alcaligenaceae bacterium CGII-47]|nr:EAL domain-containing protein [Alcaligenaceae bacterium CGII-47]
MLRHHHFVRGVILAMLLLSTAAFGQSQIVRVGIYDQLPSTYITSDGKAGGILGELLNQIALEENLNLLITPCSWLDCLDQLEAGQIDLLPDVVYTPERTEIFDFHHVAALHSWSQIYARPGSKIQSIQDLNGKRLAVLAGSTQHDYLSKLFNTSNIGTELRTVSTLVEGFKQVRANEVDAVAADHLYGEVTSDIYQLVSTPIIFQPTDLFYATQKGNNAWLLAIIDKHLSRWQAEPDSVYFKIIEHWDNPANKAVFPEQAKWAVTTLAVLLMLAVIIVVFLKIQITRRERHMRSSDNRLNTILGSIDAMISIKDRELRYIYGNQMVCQFFGLSSTDLIGRQDADFVTDEQTLATIERADHQVLDTEQRIMIEESLKPCLSDTAQTFLTIRTPLRNAAGIVEAICAISTDITGRAEAEETTHRLKFYDGLTNLPNRRLLLDRLAHTLDSARQGHATGALFILDLDHFKKINDIRGHNIGDGLLRATADRLLSLTRDRDTVSRVSGDEFVLLLNQLGSSTDEGAKNAMNIAEKIRIGMQEPFILEDKSCVVTVSIGLTLLHRHSGTVDDVMREADMAMYRAKQGGRNRVTFYEQAMQSDVEQRLWLEHDLVQALRTPQLTMHIQPQYGVDGHVTGAELLARWSHPTRGAVSPSLFIPIAEETGLISHLDEWALDEACSLLLRLQSTGETYPLSINISPNRLMEPGFLEYVSDTLTRTGAPGNRLIFEVTEGVLIHDIHNTARCMKALNLLGIRFSIDDFGTGYSNLAYLKRLPLYELKIDKSLVQDIPDDLDSSAIAKLILAMASQLDLRVVAEGVETQAQADFLFGNDCHALQGYLLARPMAIPTWLETLR